VTVVQKGCVRSQILGKKHVLQMMKHESVLQEKSNIPDNGISEPAANLYQDTADMLNVAMDTYGYACLRNLATDHTEKFQGDPWVSK
jgi:hypothetical protein